MRRAKVLGLTVVPLGLLLAPDALADGASINPGFLISGIAGQEAHFALGTELSFMYFPTDEVITEQIGIGAFLQAQTYDTDFWRYAAGIQAGSVLGGEIGWAVRERGPDSAPVRASTSRAFSRPGSWSRRCARRSR